MTAIPRLTTANSTLAVVDIQDRLLAKIPNGDDLVRNVGFLLDVATLLGVEAVATEQYPKGLGPTAPAIARRLPPNPPAKTAFSCCGAAGFLADLRAGGRPNAILVGMETHVCIAQTAMDLLEAGFTVFLPVDALAARKPRRPCDGPPASRTRGGHPNHGRSRRVRVARRRGPPAV